MSRVTQGWSRDTGPPADTTTASIQNLDMQFLSGCSEQSSLFGIMSIKIVHKTQGITDAGKDMGYQGIMCTSMLNFHPDQSGDDAAAW